MLSLVGAGVADAAAVLWCSAVALLAVVGVLAALWPCLLLSVCWLLRGSRHYRRPAGSIVLLPLPLFPAPASVRQRFLERQY